MISETTSKKASRGRARLSRIAGHPVVKVVSVSMLALTLANCSSHKSTFNKYGVKASPRVIAEGQPVPKGGGRYQVGKPYVVGGKTYVPQENMRYSETGLASWYGSDFHGRLTANGEIFDQEAIAAAHPTLPLPSYVRVTNLANRRSMIVRVNDRGPYHSNRIMDVSQAVAQALDFKRMGTANVKVDYVGRASLAGSDDKILLATLRNDGMPAQMQREQPHVAAPTMMASAQPPRQVPAQYHPAPQQAALGGPAITSPRVAISPATAAPLPPERPYITGRRSDKAQVARLVNGGDED